MQQALPSRIDDTGAYCDMLIANFFHDLSKPYSHILVTERAHDHHFSVTREEDSDHEITCMRTLTVV